MSLFLKKGGIESFRTQMPFPLKHTIHSLRHGDSCQLSGGFGGVYSLMLSYARTTLAPTVGIVRIIFTRGIYITAR